MNAHQHDLAELIQQSKDRTGRSFSEMARDGGTDENGVPLITKGRIQQLYDGEMSRWPGPSTIRALARTLNVTERAVILAVARRFGFSVDESSRLESVLPPGLDVLTDADIAAIVGYVTHLIGVRASAVQPPPDTTGRRTTGSEGRSTSSRRRHTA